MNNRIRFVLYTLLAGFLLSAPLASLCAQEAASSQHFRLEGGFCAAAGSSTSGSFHLSACLCDGVSGLAASNSFRVLAGCAAFLPFGSELRPKLDPLPRPIVAAEATAWSATSAAPGSVPQGKLPGEK